MNYNRRAKALLMGVFAATLWASAQQFTNVGGNGWWRTNPTTPNIGRGVAIGNLTATPYPAAFQIHGELMPAGNNTPEVFRTNAPTTGNTFWRMFQGGTTAGFERGQLFADPNHQSGYYQFNINAPTGHLQLLTQNVLRARLNGSVTGGSVGPFNGINRAGFLMLSGVPDAFAGTGSQAPFTRMHLIDEETGFVNPIVYAQTQGFRPWQRNGITFTGNSDQSYIGQKYAGNDNTDFVIQWSDNPNGSPWGVDRMKFVFTTQYNAGQSRGAASTNGLEAIRLWPRNNFDVNMGIGDFFAGNQLTPAVVVDPTERVDILNGRLRIRQLPDDSAAVDSFFVMVVDRTTLTPGNQERGVVKWVDPSVFGGGGADCDWTVENDGVSGPGVSHNVYTAVGVDDDCPDDDDRVGIGTATPEAKLHVKKAVVIEPGNDRAALFHNPNGAFMSIGAQGWADGGVHNVGVLGLAENSDRMYGLWGIARNGGGGAFGLRAEAYGSVTPIGVSALALGGGNATGVEAICSNGTILNHGVRASAASGQDAVGVIGQASLGSNSNIWIKGMAFSNNAWAGWFDGNVNIQNGDLYINQVFQISDASLKTEIQDVAPSSSVIDALQVHSYMYNQAAYESVVLPTGQQVGLIAQEVDQVVPQLVREVVVPAQYDSLGEVVAQSYSYKAVNYVGLIPYLISAVQELKSENATMQAQLAACCAASPTDSDQRSGSVPTEEKLTPAQERLLRIVPNPFSEPPTVQYTLERAGRMQLVANSADGKHVSFIADAHSEAGQYEEKWDTNALQPGMYYVTLLLDGEPLVKRAVKVGR